MPELKSNLEIDGEEGAVRASINPKIYSMSVIYSAAHSLTNRNYVLIDGDREIEVVVEIKPFDRRENLEELGRIFNNRLLSYQLAEQKRIENMAIKQLILYRALMTNSSEDIIEMQREKQKIPDKKEETPDMKDVNLPWEEKPKKPKNKIKRKIK